MCLSYVLLIMRGCIATLRLTAEVVEIVNALSCVAYRETQPIFSPSVGLLGLLLIGSASI